MYQDVRTLIRWRWEVLRRASLWPEVIAYLILPLGGTIVGVIGWAIGSHLRAPGPVVLWVGLVTTFVVLQAIILGTSMARILVSMYLDSDLELLLAAPVHPSAVFITRLLEILAFPGLTLSLLVVFGLWGLGVGLRVSVLFYPVALLSGLFLPMLPAAAAALFTMALVRYLPAWRLREILAVAGSLVWLVYYILQGALSRSVGNSLWPMLFAWLAGNQNAGFFSTSPGPMPANWAAWATVAVALGRPGRAAVPFLGFALLSLVAFLVIVMAAERLYMSGWANVGVVQRRRRRARQRVTREVRWLPRRTWAIMWKDWLLVRRDLRRMISLIWPIAYIFAMFGGRPSDSSGMAYAVSSATRIIDVVWMGMLFSVGFILLFLVSAFGGSITTNEGKAFWVVHSAPLSAWEWVMAKFWVGFLPALVGTTLYLVAAFLVGWWGPGGLARGMGVALIEGVGVAAVMLAVVDAPGEDEETSTSSAGLYRFLYAVGYLLVAALILVLPLGQYGTTRLKQGLLVAVQVAGLIVWTGLVVWWSLYAAVSALQRMEV